MRLTGLRTISARIILGFAALIATFGGVATWTVVNMAVVSQDIEIIRVGYLPLALTARDLSETQNQLRLHLDAAYRGEERLDPVRGRILGYQKQRGIRLRELDDSAAKLAELITELTVPGSHPRYVQQLRGELRQFRRFVERNDQWYEELEETLEETELPIGIDDPAETARLASESQRAVEKLAKNEAALHAAALLLARDTAERTQFTAVVLEAKESKLRRLFLYLGTTALLIGVLVTGWATLTLRPLRRLRMAAQRIARGDYGSRIDEDGPSEVADLARDFNSMGRAIEERERELVRSERLAAVGKMAAMITHEVRNPLSSIGLNTELLEDEMGALPGESGEEARSLCRAIQTEVDRLTDITETYLQFARLPKPKLASEQINEVIGDLVDFEREQLAARGVTLATDLGEVPPVDVDHGQIRQALLNLVRNAGEASADGGGGCVTVSSRSVPSDTGASFIEVEVADDGPGISEEVRAKLFDPFFSTKSGGTGLGLALTQQIVREHGGNIRVDSEPGRGARFVITLPALSLTAP